MEIIPTEAGAIHFFEKAKVVLLEQYGLTLTATLTHFAIDDTKTDRRVAYGSNIAWLQGFVNGLDVMRDRILDNGA